MITYEEIYNMLQAAIDWYDKYKDEQGFYNDIVEIADLIEPAVKERKDLYEYISKRNSRD